MNIIKITFTVIILHLSINGNDKGTNKKRKIAEKTQTVLIDNQQAIVADNKSGKNKKQKVANKEKKNVNEEPILSNLKIHNCTRSKKKNNHCIIECIRCEHRKRRKPGLKDKSESKQADLQPENLNHINAIIQLAELFLKKQSSQEIEKICYKVERLFIYHSYINPASISSFLINNNITQLDTIKRLKKIWYGDWKYELVKNEGKRLIKPFPSNLFKN